MSRRFVFLFPGQGSQRVGMVQALAARFPAAGAALDAADRATGRPLSALMHRGPERDLMRTINAQPAIVTGSLAALAVVTAHGIVPSAVAGHSIGELTAAHAAGALDRDALLALVAERASAMDAAARQPGSMMSVSGVDEARARTAVAAAAAHGVVVLAVLNSPQHFVLSGDAGGLDAARREIAALGGRTEALRVSGAWHSPLMAAAEAPFAAALDRARLADAAVPIYMNVDAQPARSARTIRANLVAQMTAPVLWTAVMSALMRDFPDARFVELGAGRTLVALGLAHTPRPAIYGVEDPRSLDRLLSDCT